MCVADDGWFLNRLACQCYGQPNWQFENGRSILLMNDPRSPFPLAVVESLSTMYMSDGNPMPGVIHISYDSNFKCDLHVWTRSQKMC